MTSTSSRLAGAALVVLAGALAGCKSLQTSESFLGVLNQNNRLDLLRYAVESVRLQDYNDWEIVVSDNCSEEDIAGYVESLGDSRIKYVRTERSVPVRSITRSGLKRRTC